MMMMSKPLARKILLIGWDAADWKIINPLLDAGKMPALEKIVNNGVIGNIATLDPPLSPMLWTSIATGKRADKHGILGFVEPNPVEGGVRPFNITARKCKAIWNILNSQGKKCNVISWWPSHPAEPINGAMVSNFFQKVKSDDRKKWILPKGSVHPHNINKEIGKLRVHPTELTSAHILPFVPEAAKVDQDKEKKLSSIARFVAESSSVQAATTWLMQNTEWDFTAVYFDAIDHACHAFMKYYPPQIQGIPDSDYELYKEVIQGFYIFHDMMLERLVNLAGEDTTIIITSDHGFNTGNMRSVAWPKFGPAPSLDHNPFGILCISGPSIQKDERIYGATLLDITPTILHLFGLPVGMDMDGKVLLNIFNENEKPAFINSWEEVDGDFGTHSEEEKVDPLASAEALKQLVELGYIEDPGEDKNKAMERSEMEIQYNLAKTYNARKLFEKTLPIFEELYKKNDQDIRFNIELARSYMRVHRFEEARQVINNLRKLEESVFANVDLLEGILLIYENQPDKAIEFLKRSEKQYPGSQGVQLEMGRIYNILENYDDAVMAYNRALEINADCAPAYHGLGISFLNKGLFEDAADNLLTAIGLIYHFAPSHYHLGIVFYKMEKYSEAASAFEIALVIAPKYFVARQWLIKIYSEHIKNKEKLDFHKKIIDEIMIGHITVVSGLPRSGTSLMMQILKAGGVELFTDDIRQPDENNPRGYFEFEKVKSLSKDNSWISDAKGKAIKVIAQLLYYLPKNYNFKIIFMQRNMEEIMISQQKMLGKKDNLTYSPAIAEVFKKELLRVKTWADNLPQVDILHLNYSDLINDPETNIDKIIEFLPNDLDKGKMIAAIDKDLYRNKIS
jgi:predicted AlkP superfamily phosphohydrolase/phosphomutase/tetratricopeptide (TPR) repeat protein